MYDVGKNINNAPKLLKMYAFICGLLFLSKKKMPENQINPACASEKLCICDERNAANAKPMHVEIDGLFSMNNILFQKKTKSRTKNNPGE